MAAASKGRRITLQDVAREAGVSKTTVSLVLNDAPSRLAQTTRTRVLEVADRLGYRPNLLATSMRTDRTNTIALLADRIVTTPFGWPMVAGAQSAARERGYMLLLANTEGDFGHELEAINALRDRRVDGIILGTLWHRALHAPEIGDDIPVVLMDAFDPEHRYPAVVPDDEQGGHGATTTLLRRGHRRIGFVNTANDIPARTQRHEGYQRALAEADLDYDPQLVIEIDDSITPEGGAAALHVLLDRPDPPTGIFCFNDRVASGAYRAARRRGLVIPDDLSIVGFDNEEGVVVALDPPLTTMALPHREMGHWAVDRLLDLVEGADPGRDPAELRREPCALIERASVAGPSRG